MLSARGRGSPVPGTAASSGRRRHGRGGRTELSLIPAGLGRGRCRSALGRVLLSPPPARPGPARANPPCLLLAPIPREGALLPGQGSLGIKRSELAFAQPAGMDLVSRARKGSCCCPRAPPTHLFAGESVTASGEAPAFHTKSPQSRNPKQLPQPRGSACQGCTHPKHQ